MLRVAGVTAACGVGGAQCRLTVKAVERIAAGDEVLAAYYAEHTPYAPPPPNPSCIDSRPRRPRQSRVGARLPACPTLFPSSARQYRRTRKRARTGTHKPLEACTHTIAGARRRRMRARSSTPARAHERVQRPAPPPRASLPAHLLHDCRPPTGPARCCDPGAGWPPCNRPGPLCGAPPRAFRSPRCQPLSGWGGRTVGWGGSWDKIPQEETCLLGGRYGEVGNAEYMPRGEYLSKYYGFTCQCPACSAGLLSLSESP